MSPHLGTRRHVAQQERVYSDTSGILRGVGGSGRKFDPEFDRSGSSTGGGRIVGMNGIGGDGRGVGTERKELYNPLLDKKTVVMVREGGRRVQESSRSEREKEESHGGGEQRDVRTRNRTMSGRNEIEKEVGNNSNGGPAETFNSPKRSSGYNRNNHNFSHGHGGNNSIRNPETRNGQNSNGPQRQLFDPYRDDPVKFAVAKKPVVSNTVGGLEPGLQITIGKASDERSVNSTDSFESTGGGGGREGSNIFPVSPGDVKEKRERGGSKNIKGRGGYQDRVIEESPGPESERVADSTNLLLDQLKLAIREISLLENRLKEEHRRATQVSEDVGRGDVLGVLGSDGSVLKIDRGREKAFDDSYWVKMAKSHRE
jgi:hypothetical protein